MNLTKVKVHGYKRFKEESTMHVDGKLISIVGANEAGKSSFLNALLSWNNSRAFTNSGGLRELSSDTKIDDDQIIVQCTFNLDDDDKVRLIEIPEAKEIASFVVGKTAIGGDFPSFVIPSIKRDISLRIKLLDSLKRALSNNKLKFSEKFLGAIEKVDEFPEQIEDIQQVIEVLESTEETMSDDGKSLPIIECLKLTSEYLIDEKSPKYVKDLPELIDAVISNEAREAPSQAAIEILFERIPVFAMFGQGERNLKTEYDLSEEGITNNIALQNLMDVAGINLTELIENIDKNIKGKVDSIIELGNENLKKEFASWRQAAVFPRVTTDNHILSINVGDKSRDYDSIAERSDGLRQFVALLTFIKAGQSHSEKDRILLIDEAETHLHYDAQADFIQMLTKQNLVKKVIFTTHSMGCLPEDLGNGIRFINQNPDQSLKMSKIENWFWVNERPGFSSILFSMGASTLAFIPVRNALFAEGAIDHILLPSLLKEATSREFLGFQVAPGISVASDEQIKIMDRESPTTAYLTDSDHGAKSLFKKLEVAGIPKNRIFTIPKLKSNKKIGLAIEDIIDESVYLDAINKELNLHGEEGQQLKLKDIPNFDRAKKIETLCKRKKLPLPNKRDVAYRILEIKSEGVNILSKTYIHEMAKLFNEIDDLFRSKLKK